MLLKLMDYVLVLLIPGYAVPQHGPHYSFHTVNLR